MSLLHKLTSKGTVYRGFRSHVRMLSGDSAAPASSDATETTPASFQHPRAEALFNRIVDQCSKDDVSMLGHEINKILGRTFYQNEFYYTGLGRRGARGGSGNAESETEAAPEAAKTTVDMKLVGFEAKAKIKVIKEVRSMAGLGLKEAKELVESAPSTIQKDLKPEQAEELMAKLVELGAEIELV